MSHTGLSRGHSPPYQLRCKLGSLQFHSGCGDRSAARLLVGPVTPASPCAALEGCADECAGKQSQKQITSKEKAQIKTSVQLLHTQASMHDVAVAPTYLFS